MKYLLVTAYGDGMKMGMLHSEYDSLESLLVYLKDECFYDDEGVADLLGGCVVEDGEGESWDYLIEVED